MNPIESILNYFKKRESHNKEKEKISALWLQGHDAFNKGKKYYDSRKLEEAIRCFDEAIDCGYDSNEDLYFMRGWCLQSLSYDLDAIEDFNKSISMQPEDSNYFFMRSISKGSTGDQYGRAADLKEAIRLAGIDNELTRIYDVWSKEQGYKNSAEFYDMQLKIATIDLEFLEENSDPSARSYEYYKEYFEKRANKRRRKK